MRKTIYLPKSLQKELTETTRTGKIKKDAPCSFYSDTIYNELSYTGVMPYIPKGIISTKYGFDYFNQNHNVNIVYVEDDIYFSNDQSKIKLLLELKEAEKSKKELDELKKSLDNIKKTLLNNHKEEK